MLQIQLPLPVKFIIGFIYSTEDVYKASKKILEKKFGPIDFQSRCIDFAFTDYYTKEMGQPLFRKFLSFKKLQKCEKAVTDKLFCIKLEKKYAIGGRRTINIDPGYLNEAKLVLTTTKDFSHRIHLGKGVYAEVTLRFENKCFSELPTTFPDYRTKEYKDIFNSIRKIYRDQIKK